MKINGLEESQKIISFIQKSFSRSRKTTAIIGLSGGIDSAVSFVLTLKALGPENIQAFHLPSKTSNQIHLIHIKELLSLSAFPIANFHIIPINSIIQKTWRIIRHYNVSGARIQEFAPAAGPRLRESRTQNSDSEPQKLRLANLSARIRMMMLFDAAKKYDGLVVGTENKSESMLGYFTRFGDSASDLEPITHLFKTQVIELAKYLNIPQPIINKSPSADLWPGQTDEVELGFSYKQADPILEQISLGKKPSAELAKKINTAIQRNAFKHQVPYCLDK